MIYIFKEVHYFKPFKFNSKHSSN